MVHANANIMPIGNTKYETTAKRDIEKGAVTIKTNFRTSKNFYRTTHRGVSLFV